MPRVIFGRVRDDQEAGDVVIAMITLSGRGVPRSSPLRATLADIADVEEAEVELSRSEGGRVFSVGEWMLATTAIPQPIPWSELEGPAATAFWWPEATVMLRKHKAHLLMALMRTPEMSPLERRLAMTRLVAAALPNSDATGVYWGEGTLVYPPGQWRKAANAATLDSPPVQLWVDVRVEPLDDKHIRCFTTGRTAFGLPEMEVPSTTADPDLVYGLIGDTTTYQITTGAVIKSGETIGHDAETRFPVTEGPSMFDRDPVLRIDMGGGSGGGLLGKLKGLFGR